MTSIWQSIRRFMTDFGRRYRRLITELKQTSVEKSSWSSSRGPQDVEPSDREPKVSRASIASLVFGLLLLVPVSGLLAIAFGISAILRIRKDKERYRGVGLATTGIILGIAQITVVLPIMGTFTLQPEESAIVLRLGDIQRIVDTPGTNFKIPLLELTLIFPSGTLDMRSDALEAKARDGGSITLRGNLRWRICQPDRFYLRFGSDPALWQRLNAYLDRSFRSEVMKEVRKYDLREFTSAVAIPPLQKAVNSRLAENLAKSGICVEDGSELYKVIRTSENQGRNRESSSPRVN